MNLRSRGRGVVFHVLSDAPATRRPLVVGSSAEYGKASNEHGSLTTTGDAAGIRLGDKLKLIPGHCDPTVNLHDWLVGIRNGVVEVLWPITARGMMF